MLQFRGNKMNINKAGFVDAKSKSRGAHHTGCDICGGWGYDKWTHQYVVITSGPLNGVTVCEKCLKARNFQERAEQHAAKVEERIKSEHEGIKEYIKALRTQSQCDVPTYEEWRTLETEAEANYGKGTYPDEIPVINP